MQPETVMTLHITSRPFQALGKCSPTSKWDPLFAQLTPESACIEGFEEEEDARACATALKKWIDKRGIAGKARATKRNADGQPCVWLCYDVPPATTWKPDTPATFADAEPATPKAKAKIGSSRPGK